ncbi:hypothetical protein CN510_16910 [Priestia megaterium]|uniref:hypothetical protein n=1 Tax=Priestia megaterium TaxID=1404 RepID=UPI000BF8A95A|nr:hypothetical protein [Priestia megaterium]PES94726.1 hypothetical protein CN510_16910 [Priestia megaterium]
MENVVNVVSHIISQMKSISLKDYAALVQIGFYIIGATLAILTYKSAKRGLLNTVNTEYQKRVMDHLHELSETLYAELKYKPDSKESSKYDFSYDIQPIAKRMLEQYKTHVKDGNDPKKFTSRGSLLPVGVIRLNKFKEKIQSDPFIPDHIAQYVIDYTYKRFVVSRDIIIEELREFENSLKNQEHKDYQSLPFSVSKNVSRRIAQNGFSHGRIREEVHKIRMMIKDYLKSFNPLP